MTKYSINPGMRPGEGPHFYEMGEYPFQEFCRDIFDVEPSVATCDIYGESGQAQDGIDLIASRYDGDGVEVGQCKCYKDFQPKDIRDASDEFFKHWDRWSRENVKRFILFVASDLNTTQRQNEILSQRKRFTKYSITYEVWGASKIRNKLRAHPGIVSNYLKPEDFWVKEICGQVLASYPLVSNVYTGFPNLVDTAIQLQSQFEGLVSQLSKETTENLERMRDAWREGEKSRVIKWINILKGDATRWEVLTPEIKAKVLRFEAGLKLEMAENIEAAKKLADEAYVFDPSTQNEARIRALLARFEFGPKNALGFLDGLNDLDSLNLLAGLYLELNDTNRCGEILNAIEENLIPNAETFRLKALLALASKDVNKAQDEIDRALDIAPRWIAIRYASAIIDYSSALSPAFLPDRLMLWPEPVDWIMVQRDWDSTERLRNASKIFEDLLTIDPANELLQAWYLASMMIDLERHEKSIEIVESILFSNPSNSFVIAWVLTRNLDIDLTRSIKSLEKIVLSGKENLHHIVALVGIFAKQQIIDKATDLLSKTKEKFVVNEAEGLWVFWNVQILILTGNMKKAQEFIDSYEIKSDEIRYVQGLVLAKQDVGIQSREKFVKFLEEQYEQTNDPIFLLQSCEVEYRNQNWEYIVGHAEFLINKIKTADALRVVIVSTYNTKSFNQCLDLIDTYHNLFGHRGLPADMRRLRASCLQAQGKLREAVAEVEALSLDNKSLEDFRQQAQMYLLMGDLKKLSLVGRRLISLPDLDPGEALGLAHVLRQEDFSLAQMLWKKATSQDLPDSLVGNALALGYSLGLDKELNKLHQRMQAIANKGEKGMIQVFSLEELVEKQKEIDQHHIDLNTLYQDGKIPVHVLAERVNISLTDLYHAFLVEREKQSNYLAAAPLLIRHGGKVLGIIENIQNYQVNVDITSLLLAYHLGILENVENIFRTLRLPPELIPSLVEMRDKALHHQPSRLEETNKIIELVEKRKIKVNDPIPVRDEETQVDLADPLKYEREAFYVIAIKKGGYILDFVSHLNSYKDLPGDATSSILYSKNIADYLFQHGLLNKNRYHAVIQNLGTEGQRTGYETIPETGASIFCFGNVISTLADVEILELACEQFNIYIQDKYLDQIRKESIYFEKLRKQQFEWVGSLIEVLRGGLENGKYVLIPPPSNISDEYPLYGLRTIFSLPKENNNLILVDDRYLNGYSNKDGIPIIGINEILLALVNCGEIDQDRYFSLLHKMRVDNLCYVHIEANEISHFLRQSQIKSHVLIETSELSTLRHYFAATVLRGNILQKPSDGGSPNPQGELYYLFQTASAVADAIEKIWSLNDISIEDKQIYSDWIIANLFISHLGLSEAIGLSQDRENEINLFALSLANLVTRSLLVEITPQAGRASIRQDYLVWLYERVLRNHFETNPILFERTVEILKHLLLGIKDEDTDIPAQVVNAYIQNFCSMLPAPIFDECKKDDEFMEAIGLITIYTVVNWEIVAEDFWHAAYEAANNREAEITPLGQKEKIIFSPNKTEGGIIGVLVSDINKNEQFLIKDLGIELLNDSSEVQTRYLQKHRQWFDLPKDEFEETIAKIVSIKNPQNRVERALKWKDLNLKLFYSQLFGYLRDNRQFTGNDLIPPDTDGMLRFYRLLDYEDDEPFYNLWKNLTEELVTLQSSEHAFERISCVPIPLPDLLINSIEKYDATQKRVLIKKLLKVSKSPIAFFHLVKLLVRFGENNLKYQRLAIQKLKYMLSDEFNTEVSAFLNRFAVGRLFVHDKQ